MTGPTTLWWEKDNRRVVPSVWRQLVKNAAQPATSMKNNLCVSFMQILNFYHQQRCVITERIAVRPGFAGFP